MADATTVSIALADTAATREFGTQLAEVCKPGAIVLLRGPLGAGKTTLVDAFVRALGAPGATSPTFVIAHAHLGGRYPVWHLDLYRMENQAQVAELDLEQYVSPAAITLCEWPERAADFWPSDVLTIDLAVEDKGRRALVAASGPQSNALVNAFMARRQR